MTSTIHIESGRSAESRRTRLGVALLLAAVAAFGTTPTAAQFTPASPPARSTEAGGQSEPIRFSASDSLVIQFVEEGQTATLKGEARVATGDMDLQAYHIDLDFQASELRARGLATDTGTVGMPGFTRGNEQVLGRELAYNMDSGRGRVVGARSQIEQGILLGGITKQIGDSVLYVRDAMYTTCEHDDPHYHVRSRRMKIVDGKWIYTGPLHLRILNIPLPIWLPFGFLPAQEGRRSGPLPPTYGEDERGFFLRDFGWYWAINDYLDFQTRLGIWTQGSFQIAPQFRYAKRYGFTGRASVDWVRNRRGLKRDPDFTVVNTWSIRANHNHTVTPTANITANIDFATSNYLRTVSRQYNDQVRQTIGSNVQFNKRWGGKSLTLYLNQRQTLSTGEVAMTLPRLNFSQQTRRPFARSSQRSDSKWYEQITLSYSGRLDNNYSFRRDTSLAGASDINWLDALLSADKYRTATGTDERFDFKSTHQIPIAAAFNVRKMRLNLSPFVSYQEDWYLRSDRKSLKEDSSGTKTESVPGFLSVRQIRTGVNASSEFYGIFPFRVGRFNGFRHVVRPSISYAYRPDLSTDFWGYYREYTNASGDTISYPIVSGISAGRQQNLSFRMGNVIQARRMPRDTTGSATPSTVQILTLDLSSAYNMAADSLKWSPMNLTARTRLVEKFDLNLSASLDPYARNEFGRRINRFQISEGGGLLRLTNLSFTARTTLQSKRRGQSRPYSGLGERFGGGMDGSTSEMTPFAGTSAFDATRRNTPVGYADFAIPWSLNLDFNYQLSRVTTVPSRRAILNAGFDMNLTPKWKVQGRTGYDFVEAEIVTTNITILRDFHDWEMGLNWTPFGQFQSYQFDIHLKTGPLKDLLRLSHPRSDVKGRFTQFAN